MYIVVGSSLREFHSYFLKLKKVIAFQTKNCIAQKSYF